MLDAHDGDTMGISGDEMTAIENAVLNGLRNARIERENEQARQMELNALAQNVATMSRKAGSPINAYHARADIDELLKRGKTVEELIGYYEKFYSFGPDVPADERGNHA